MKKIVEKVGIVFLSFLMTFALSSCGGDGNDATEDEQQFSKTDVAVTGKATDIGMTYATINGYVNFERIPYSISSLEIGIEVSTDETFPDSNSRYIGINAIEGNKFTADIQGLNFSTTYYYRTFVKSNSLYFYGRTQSFATKELKASVAVSDAEGITFTSANVTLDLSKVSFSASETMFVGLAYSEDKQLLNLDSLIDVDEIRGVDFAFDTTCADLTEKKVTTSIKELKPGHTYYYCAYLAVGRKVVSSEVKSFSTLQFQSQQLITNNVIDVALTTAKVSGTTTLAERLASIYPAGTQITYGISYTQERAYPDWTDDDFEEHTLLGYLEMVAPLEGGSFTAELTRLQPNTTYLYRAYIRIGNTDILAGAVKRFTTKSVDDYMSTEVREVGVTSTTIVGKSMLKGLYSNVQYTLNYRIKGDDWTHTVPMAVQGDSISVTLSTYYSKEYEYWVSVQADGKSMETGVNTFKTLDPRDFITLHAAANVTANSAVLTFSVDPKYCDDNPSGHFYYGLTKENISNLVNARANGTTATATLSNLRPGTTYYYRAQVLFTLGVGYADWFYSDIKSFTTLNK